MSILRPLHVTYGGEKEDGIFVHAEPTPKPTLKSFIPNIPEPEQVSRTGCMSRISSKLDQRSWLEVEDPKHRYAKNLRSYFQAWSNLGEPTGNFWHWLDEGHEIDSLPRRILDSDTVHYCSPEEVSNFALSIDSDGVIRHAHSGELVDTPDNGWIFVLRDGVLYATEKKTTAPRFHHSSFWPVLSW